MTAERLEILDGTGRVHRITRPHLAVLRVLSGSTATVPDLPELIGVTIDVARHLVNQLYACGEIQVSGSRRRARLWTLTQRGWNLTYVLGRNNWMENR